MGTRTDTRDRMISAAKAGFRSHGMVATGFTEVLERAGAARGAIYHHFPGGKEELAIAVVASTAENVEAALRDALVAGPSPGAAVASMIEHVATAVDRSGGAFGCPVAPAVLEASGSEAILAAGDEAFGRWRDALAEGFASALGDDADDLATLLVASVEGALVLCRASGSGEPLRQVGRALGPLLSVGAARGGRRTRAGRDRGAS